MKMKLILAILITFVGNAVCETITQSQALDDPFLTKEHGFDYSPRERSLQFEDLVEYSLGNATCVFNFTDLISSDEIVCTQDLEAPSTSNVMGALYGGNCTDMSLSPPDFLNVTVSKSSSTSAVSAIQFSRIPVAEIQGETSLTEFCLKTIVAEDDFEMNYMKTPIAVEFQYDGSFSIITGVSKTEIQDEANSKTKFTPIAYRCNPDFTTNDSLLPIGSILYVCVIPNPKYKDVKIDKVRSFGLIQRPAEPTTPPGQAPNSSPTPNSNIPDLFQEISSGTCNSVQGYKNINDGSKCFQAMEELGKSNGGDAIEYTNNVVGGCSFSLNSQSSNSVDLFLNSGTCNTGQGVRSRRLLAGAPTDSARKLSFSDLEYAQTTTRCVDLDGAWQNVESTDECGEANIAFGRITSTFHYNPIFTPAGPCGCSYHAFGSLDFWGVQGASNTNCNPNINCGGFRGSGDLGCYCKRDAVTSAPTQAPLTPAPTHAPVTCECSQLQLCICERKCIICDDVMTEYISENNLGGGCSTAKGVISRQCNKTQRWRSNKYCQLSCYNAGNGYAGDICCNAYNNDVTVSHVIQESNADPVTIVVAGSVDEAPSDTVSKSQVSRGLVIGTRLPAKFFSKSAPVNGVGEVTFASARRLLHSKFVLSRGLQENGAGGFDLSIELQTIEANPGSVLKSISAEMNMSLIVSILCTIYYFH